MATEAREVAGREPGGDGAPWWRDRILCGDAVEVLRELPDGCARCCVTSPPYWGLRDYGVAGQIGLEATPDEWVARLVAVFREVRRVLADDGTCWINVGDAYASHDPAGWREGEFLNPGGRPPAKQGRARNRSGIYRPTGLKPKDLIGLPWMLAFALRADGWWLRSDIIFSKLNPMPESTRDRPTHSHEYIFLLTKRPNYYYDAAAIAEPASGGAHPRKAGRNSRMFVDRDVEHARRARRVKMPDGWDTGPGGHGPFHRQGREKGRYVERAPGVTPKSATPGQGIRANESFHEAVSDLVERRNKRSVWELCSEPFPQAHFATYPTKLVEPCVLAGSRPGDVVLDPFLGSGTTALVAKRLGRHYVGVELSAEYVKMAERRLAVVPGYLWAGADEGGATVEAWDEGDGAADD